jgi:hypothetical protein
MSLKRTEIQQREFCAYARDNKRIRAQYVNWIEEKWSVKAPLLVYYKHQKKDLVQKLSVQTESGINQLPIPNSSLHSKNSS